MAVNYNDIQKMKSTLVHLTVEDVKVIEKVIDHLTPVITEGSCPECANSVGEYDKFCPQCGKALVLKER